jgi:hypothetical protein
MMKRGSLCLQSSNSTSKISPSTVRVTNSGRTIDSGYENSISETLEICNVKKGRTEY